MIDKPIGKTETLMERCFSRCRDGVDFIKAKFSKPAGAVSRFGARHPFIFKCLKAVVCVGVCGLVIVGFATPKTVILRIDDSNVVTESVYNTTYTRVDTFLAGNDIEFTYLLDEMNVELYEPLTDGMRIEIREAFEVAVKVDGETLKLKTLPVTTSEVLSQLGVTLHENDIVEPELDKVIRKGDKITVKRVTLDYITEEVKTDFDVIYQADSSLVIGETKVAQKGRKGIQKKTYLAVYIDSEEVSRTLLESETIQKGRNKIISYGTKILSGVPSDLSYLEKISHVRAVSYYYSGTPRGVYGMPCEYGTCAVDKTVIPLGSLLYIEGYGYAVANDVGSAIKGKTVDLYMEKFSQCAIWGARWTNVYIIKYGDNTRYWER